MSGEIGQHWNTTLGNAFGPFSTINIDTLFMTWAAMALILLIALVIKSNLKLIPGRLQVVGEALFSFNRDIAVSTGGKKAESYVFFIGSLFLFIMTANLMGQLPLKLIHIPVGHLGAATGDFNTPVALALLTVIMYFTIGISRKGLGYFKHYFSPFPVFFPLNLLEDFTKPFSLSLRLFANILVGEILAMIAMFILPIGLPVFTILIELFVAILQAYIFAVLSSVYIAMVSAEDH